MSDVLDRSVMKTNELIKAGWYSGPKRGTSKTKGKRAELVGYAKRLEKEAGLEPGTAHPANFLMHVMATGRDPRFKGELSVRFPYQDRHQALAMLKADACPKGEDGVTVTPVEGRDYPIGVETRIDCAAKLLQVMMPKLTAIKVSQDELNREGEDDSLEASGRDQARELAAMPQVRDLMESVQQALTSGPGNEV